MLCPALKGLSFHNGSPGEHKFITTFPQMEAYMVSWGTHTLVTSGRLPAYTVLHPSPPTSQPLACTADPKTQPDYATSTLVWLYHDIVQELWCNNGLKSCRISGINSMKLRLPQRQSPSSLGPVGASDC